MYKEKIKELLLSTGRKGMDKLIEHMENEGFFTAPCSTRFHLAEEGGLAEHSFNVYENALKIANGLGYPISSFRNSIVIVSLLHDLGKMGQFGKASAEKYRQRRTAADAEGVPERT